MASAIVMIILAFLNLLYLKGTKPFRHDFNNYLEAVSQLFLVIFYGEILLISIFGDAEYNYFRKILGLCLAISIFAYMILSFIAALVIYFRKSRCKHKIGRNSLSKLIKEKGLGMQQILAIKKSVRRLKSKMEAVK